MNVSTHQQSGNPTGSRIRRLVICTECEFVRNIAEVCLLSSDLGQVLHWLPNQGLNNFAVWKGGCLRIRISTS